MWFLGSFFSGFFVRDLNSGYYDGDLEGSFLDCGILSKFDRLAKAQL